MTGDEANEGRENEDEAEDDLAPNDDDLAATDDDLATNGDDLATNDGQRFDRLPPTPAERTVEGRVSRQEVLDYYEERFGIPPETFEEYSFWEKGAGKIWIYAGEAPSPTQVEALGMLCLRTRQEHWKPTTDVAQRFGRHASRCVIDLSREEARRFAAGEDQELDWDGDWGYLIATHPVTGGADGLSDRDSADERGDREPLGIGLYVHGEFRSLVPKGRRRDL